MRAACTIERHAEIKADRDRWRELPPQGIQRIDDGGPALELRLCPACRSTLAIDICTACHGPTGPDNGLCDSCKER